MKSYPDSTEKIFSIIKKKYGVNAPQPFLPYDSLNNLYAVCDNLRINKPLMFHCLCDLIVGLFKNNKYMVYRDVSMFVSVFSKDLDAMYAIKKGLAIESKILNSVDKRVDEVHKFLSLVIYALDSQDVITRFMKMSKDLQATIQKQKRGDKTIEASFILEGYDFLGTYLDKPKR